MTLKFLLKFTIETGARFTEVTVRGRKQHSIELLPPGGISLTRSIFASTLVPTADFRPSKLQRWGFRQLLAAISFLP